MSFLSRLRPRYTLRTLLVVVTLLCFAIGSQVYKARKLREAVEMVKHNGGSVMYAYERDYKYALMDKTTKLSAKSLLKEPKGPQWLRDQFCDAYFNNVVEVMLRNGHLTDDELRDVCRFTGLEQLCIGSHSDDKTSVPPRIEITDAGVLHLQNLPKLKTLSLVGTKITNQAVRNLRGLPSLESLNLENSDLDDDCVPFFKTAAGDSSGFPVLKHLNLIHTRITDKGLAAVVRQLPALEQIQVAGPLITPEGVKAAESQRTGLIYYYPIWPPPQ